MRVGIYNRHLTGVGGGEKHMLAMAEILSRRYPVDVLTHRVLDLEAAGAQLGVDLSRVCLRALEDRPEPQLAPATAGYDLFINASDGSFLPSQAERSMLLVYFPTPVSDSVGTRLRWYVGRYLRKVLLPRYAAGFYGPEKRGSATVRWTKPQARLELPAPPRAEFLDVRLWLTADRAETLVGFSSNERELETCAVPAGTFCSVDVRVPVDGDGVARLDISAPPAREGAKYERSIAIADVKIDTARHRLYDLLFRRWFRELGQRLESLYPALDLDHLDTYDVICANSRYTQDWIRRYWGRDSEVFYPPVDVGRFEPLPKQQRILSVGRFFTTGHNKKHFTMIRAFQQMVAEELEGWELHLAGGTSLGSGNADYLARVRREAEGWPIHIHADVPFAELCRLYGESSIYWHAAGYAEDPERHPLRYEHFGLTTVEAMAAGAVPVVIDGGGQPEIVSHGVDGFLWRSIDELKALTGRLVRDDDLRRHMSVAARERSRAFGRNVFEAELWRLVDALGASRR